MVLFGLKCVKTLNEHLSMTFCVGAGKSAWKRQSPCPPGEHGLIRRILGIRTTGILITIIAGIIYWTLAM